MAMAAALISLLFLHLCPAGLAGATAKAPAIFVFGDSILDPGNNNNLFTFVKADHSPNGVDFPNGVTGRFCNGGTIVDHLGYHLGLGVIPAFNNPATTGSAILQGVNFASAASGILYDTGKLYGNIIPMDEQIQNFKLTLRQLSLLLLNRTQDYLRRSLFFVEIGSNDYINNYLLPFSHRRKNYPPETFSLLVIQQLGRQLKELHSLGARKFLIAGLAPLGCAPSQIASQGNDSGACVDSTNKLASIHNVKLKAMLDEYNTQLHDSNFLYWDTYSFTLNVINNYASYGFRYQNKACCGAGRHKGEILCLPFIPPCRNRLEYIFWDSYHPTDAFNVIASKEAYQGNLQASFPQNVQQLLESY